MNKKTIYIIVAVLVVVIVVAVAGIMLSNNNGNTNPSTSPTPTAPPTIVGASTLKFNVNDTSGLLYYTYSCKNFNTSTEVLRVDLNIGLAGNYSYIIDMGQAKSWASTDGGATWTASTDFAGDTTNYASPFYAYVNAIVANGSTADFAYTSIIDIKGIEVNPTFASSVFATS